MSRPIKEGDIVTAIFYTDCEELIKNAEVLSMPADTGDMIYLKTESGAIHSINSNCSSFSGLVKKSNKETADA